MTQSPRIRLRLIFSPAFMFGPGKADLLGHIDDTGSISAAGRAMGMSYKRAWSLVEEMNAAFADPLVDSARGGPGGGGAHLTPAGKAALAHYRAIEALACAHGQAPLAALQDMLRPPPTKDDMSGGK